MDHMPWLLERSSANGGLEPCGHALMASCPPEPFTKLSPSVPFGHIPASNQALNGVFQAQQAVANTSSTGVTANRNFSRHTAPPPGADIARPNGNSTPRVEKYRDTQESLRTWELSKSDLNTLLDLSQKLNLDGEITPIMAWGMILGHPRLGELDEADFRELSECLRSRVRCYGYVTLSPVWFCQSCYLANWFAIVSGLLWRNLKSVML